MKDFLSSILSIYLSIATCRPLWDICRWHVVFHFDHCLHVCFSISDGNLNETPDNQILLIDNLRGVLCTLISENSITLTLQRCWWLYTKKISFFFSFSGVLRVDDICVLFCKGPIGMLFEGCGFFVDFRMQSREKEKSDLHFIRLMGESGLISKLLASLQYVRGGLVHKVL